MARQRGSHPTPKDYDTFFKFDTFGRPLRITYPDGETVAAGQAVHRAPHREGERPFVQAHTPDTERVVDALLGSGDEAVEGHRDPEA